MLDYVWTGKFTRGLDGTMMPVNRAMSLSDVDNPDEWWEVPNSSPMARTIRLYYPWITAEVGPEGELVSVSKILTPEEEEAKRQEELLKEAMQNESVQRGYKKSRRLRPRGLMPFLK